MLLYCCDVVAVESKGSDSEASYNHRLQLQDESADVDPVSGGHSHCEWTFEDRSERFLLIKLFA